MHTWLYGERFESIARHHVLSEGGHPRVVEFWWDVRFLDGQDLAVSSDEASFRVHFYAFQAALDPVPDRPKLWFVTTIQAATESDAVRCGRAAASYAAGALGLATRLPFQPTGNFRVTRAASTEHGFFPDFEGDDLRGFTVLLEPQKVESDDVAARKSEPLHQGVVGTIKNEKYLQIGFSDVIRQVDQNSNVDVGDLHICSEDVVAVVAGDSLHIGNDSAVRVAEIYSDGISQRDPRSQFLVLWSAIELLTNSVASERLLKDADIMAGIVAMKPYDRGNGFVARLLQSLFPDRLLRFFFRARGTSGGFRDYEYSLARPRLTEDAADRIEGALKVVDTLTFRAKVRVGFEDAFGECEEGADRAVAGLRKLRGSLVHQRSLRDPDEAELIGGLSQLRRALRRHLDRLSRTSRPAGEVAQEG